MTATTRTQYIVRALQPRTGTEPTPPRVGDLMPWGDGPRPTLYRVAKIEPARAGVDDEAGTISHYFRLDETHGSRAPFVWMPHPANYDAVRVTSADYFANNQH